MRVQVLVPVTVVVSLVLFGLVKVRRKTQEMEEKRTRFGVIRLRVSTDVLSEYRTQITQQQQELERNRDERKAQEEDIYALKDKKDEAIGKMKICKEEKKDLSEKQVSTDTEVTNLRGENDKEMASWKKEVESLKQKLAAPSAVCDFLKDESDLARTLCGKEVKEAPKKEEAKEEAPKKEEAKEEAPKKEEAKEEAPKKEEAKEEAPKKEEAKEEAPKKEEAKEEAPKKEEAKEEAPKKR
ncbi:translation initiation factor IF-2-like isoform X7 [Hippoglossus hippoglossus]|uniref:translation initiation factor IF-2-like isoform X7 n=1 Tax=Hippoglossus hippoglossus TaxID=8267 RepID=UPI00148D8C5B|nr:translation initiation factor IF-2-like isoform X7 [Hippoglossus hippoglossus]